MIHTVEEVVTLGDLQALSATISGPRWAFSGKLDSMDEMNWYEIMSRALTSIRHDWPVTKLQKMANEDHFTAVSGDVIMELRKR